MRSVLMRQNVSKGLVILAFVATVCAALAAAEPQKPTSDTWALRRPFQDDIVYRRFLTARKLTGDERAVSTSSVESLIKSTVSTEQLNAWLKRGDTTNYVFKALKLQKAGDGLLDTRTSPLGSATQRGKPHQKDDFDRDAHKSLWKPRTDQDN
ncbi:hypothetical protein PI124_g17953 [Phytophthora idaei]|nr:hypothetical protein PI125_g18622 [Phytophthora idaei]KAG3170023.1 hypothetical protein PI126_g2515 [Phytophthora idaei]KAG3237044.1 hypothetical protein PI124_g17953 [Phytophthora idaei]